MGTNHVEDVFPDTDVSGLLERKNELSNVEEE